MNPVAKREGLRVEKIGDEIVILDQTRNHAHRLNRTMALVWQHCDGKHSVADLSQLLRGELNSERADQQVVVMALDQLRDLFLIELDAPQPMEAKRISRREMARTLAIATALLPSIVSIVVPTPAQAKSSRGIGSSSDSSGVRSNDHHHDHDGDHDHPDRHFGHRDGDDGDRQWNLPEWRK